MITKPKIKLNMLEKSLASLKKAINSPLLNNPECEDFMRDSVVQRFEYTYELCRNLIRRILGQEFEEKDFTVKDGYRLAGKYGLLENVENWLNYHETRNATSHRYEEETALETFEEAKKFANDAEILLQKLKKILDDKAN